MKNFLAGISIIDDLDDGEYESAAMKSFLFVAGKGLGKIGLGWMSTAYSVGSFYFGTDHGKRMRFFATYRVYKDAEKALIEAYKNGDVNSYEKLEYKWKGTGRDFNKLCDELGVPHLKVNVK